MVHLRTLRLGLLGACCLLLLVPAVVADTVGSEARIVNSVPEILSWSLSMDPSLGVMLYRVEATDGNGVEDLSMVVLRVEDARGRMQTLTDDKPTLDGRRAAVWNGVFVPTDVPPVGPYKVELRVYDQAGGEARGAQPAYGLDAVKGIAKDNAPKRPARLLASAVDAIHPAPLAWISLAGLATVVVTTTAIALTRRP